MSSEDNITNEFQASPSDGPVADEEVLNVIRTMSQGNSNYDPFDKEKENSESVHPYSSIAKGSMIMEASPEPETNQVQGCVKDDENEAYYSEKYRSLKKLKFVLISLIVGLGVAFLCTLVGVIVLATSKSTSSASLDIPESTPIVKLFSIPRNPLEFVHVDSKTPEIAEAFADYSLYQTFYGVTYNGTRSGPHESSKEKRSLDKFDKQPASSKTDSDMQQRITLDIALLSRVTSRLRLANNEDNLIERVIQALQDLNFRMDLTLNIAAAEWEENSHEFMRILRSYSLENIKAIHIERENASNFKKAVEISTELAAFFEQYDLQEVKVQIVDAQADQPNPLKLTGTPKVAVEWVNDDQARNVYTNLVTPSETSERARFMTSWVCGVVPKLDREIEWFWSVAFDDYERGIENGIFTEDRKAKPACLPRCIDYKS